MTASIGYAENPVAMVNGKKLPEAFPQAMTYHTLTMNKSIPLNTFKQRVNEFSPYPFILAPGDSERSKIMRDRFPHQIYTLIASHGGINSDLSKKVWPGHWLYKAGTILAKDISPTDKDILLEDLKKIVAFPNQFNKNLDKQTWKGIWGSMVLYALDNNGKPDWSTAEQLIITKVAGQKLTVERGQFGTTARAFKAGKTVAARHTLYWEGQMQLNFSLQCPRGGPGNLTAGEWYAREVANRVTAEVADGVEFDVSRWTFAAQKDSDLDVDNDRTPDHGYIDGINSFGLGSEIFYRELRKLLGPNKIIQGDSDYAINGIRGMKYVNGIQMEAFPYMNDLDRFSEAFLHLRHFLDRGEAYPRLSYPYTKLGSKYFGSFTKTNSKDKKNVNSQFRIGLATATLMGMPHPFANKGDWFMLPDRNGKEQEALGAYYWDEYHGGDLNNWQWLGRPIGPALQDLTSTKNNNLLSGVTWQWKVERGFTADKTTGEIYSANTLSIPKNILPQNAWFAVSLESTQVKAPLPKGNEYTLEFEARGDDTWRYKSESIDRVPRMIVISDLQKYKMKQPPAVLVDSKWSTYRISFISGAGTIFPPQFGVSEQVGSTSIRNIKIYSGSTERWSREFENGLVLLNMTIEPWKYKVQNGAYCRLKGTEAPDVNNGEKIASEIIVPPRDAVFLVKNSMANSKNK